MKVYIGYDPRERAAYTTAQATLRQTSRIDPEALHAERLAAVGLLRRTVDQRHGQFYDLPSNAPASTEFATSRFIVPILCQQGWALFTDCDVLFLEDVHRLLDHVDTSKAVWVVQHPSIPVDTASGARKMDGQPQVTYPRKNWSSVMLFNCDHPANRRLTLQDVNGRPGRDLHGFYWLHDAEIGALPAAWNWLVNVAPRPDKPCIAHYTLGGPWLPNWAPKPHDDLWLQYYGR